MTSDLAARIVSHLRGFRFRLDSEKILQAQVADALAEGGFAFLREHRLTLGDVIDLLVGDVGIEIKIKGHRRAIYRQCARYCESEALAALVVVTSVAMGFPTTIANKPIYVVSLGKAWLG